MDEYTEKAVVVDETLKANALFGTHVLTPDGAVVGKIHDVHLNSKGTSVSGVSVKPGMLRKPIFVGADYIESIQPQGTRLRVRPTFLLLGKKIITSDGKILGKVVGVERLKRTINIVGFTVKSKFFFTKQIPYEWVKHEGTNILLSKTHEHTKQHLKKS